MQFFSQMIRYFKFDLMQDFNSPAIETNETNEKQKCILNRIVNYEDSHKILIDVKKVTNENAEADSFKKNQDFTKK